MSPISLEDLNLQGDLLQRFDTKYLIQVHQIDEILETLSGVMMILEKDNSRLTDYRTTYFDTEDFRTYFDHLKQRRKRFKIRVRTYSDASNGFLEIKIKLPRGQTQKARWPIDSSDGQLGLTNTQIDNINQALLSASYEPLSLPYRPTLSTTFTRITLFNPTTPERITIDFDLNAHSDESSVNLGRQFAILEVKSQSSISQSNRFLSQMGIQPTNVSKYCVAMNALHDDKRGAPWRAALRLLQEPRIDTDSTSTST